MLHVVSCADDRRSPVLASMFAARKRVFVDLLKWDVPVLDGRYEVDQFDDEHATYLVLADRAGRHLGSARLLPTSRPHILDRVFPALCAAEPPRGVAVAEITSEVLTPRRPSSGRATILRAAMLIASAGGPSRSPACF